ncbi:MFS transporter [Methanococcoides burtonii]|uniref:Major facilitator superfamily multidrug transporter n=1 Tax=Methanococcoides burtonii (strain DSM 6242 / NBRC 107633 / OCM 468 / ACE-M) TaxID=259564 RepID=Q12TZ3_METBU|nr:MFS transporter [Methanococcoides burtonii]ABE53083.1 major facilitator superfamily multidrug transporter [Methanococcoides burtonii DSM 6242]
MQFKPYHLSFLAATAFFAMAGGAILAPVLPQMVGPLGRMPHEVAQLMTVYTISTAIFSLVIGHFVDRVNRKTILVPCLVLNGLMGLLSFFATDLETLLVLRFVQGVGIAGMMSLVMLVIGDVYEGLDRVHSMGRISMAIAIGSVTAPLIGGGLATVGWNYPFLFYVLSLPFSLLMWMLLPETKNNSHHETARGLGEALRALKDIRIAYTVFLSFAIFFLLFSIIVYIPFMLKDIFGFAAKEAGLVLSIQGIAIILVASTIKRIASKFSLPVLIGSGLFLMATSIFLISFSVQLPVLFLLLLVFGAGFGLTQTSTDTQIIQIAPLRSKGGVLSIYNTMKYLGQSAAPITLGIILLYFGLQAVFILSGIFGLLVAVTTFMVRSRFE